jgi:hypothetical protein
MLASGAGHTEVARNLLGACRRTRKAYRIVPRVDFSGGRSGKSSEISAGYRDTRLFH